MCGLGVLTAIVGLVVGVVGLLKGGNRGQAITGIVLSGLTVVLGIVGFVLFVTNFQECFNLPSQAEAQQCVEQKLGVTPQSP